MIVDRKIYNESLSNMTFLTFTEKVYNRQISAPILKRKSSRFGLGQFLSGSSNANNTANVVATNIGHGLHHSHSISASNTQSVHHLHITQAQSSSAGTTPTTPNLMGDKPHQAATTSIPATSAGTINLGAPGR